MVCSDVLYMQHVAEVCRLQKAAWVWLTTPPCNARRCPQGGDSDIDSVTLGADDQEFTLGARQDGKVRVSCLLLQATCKGRFQHVAERERAEQASRGGAWQCLRLLPTPSTPPADGNNVPKMHELLSWWHTEEPQAVAGTSSSRSSRGARMQLCLSRVCMSCCLNICCIQIIGGSCRTASSQHLAHNRLMAAMSGIY